MSDVLDYLVSVCSCCIVGSLALLNYSPRLSFQIRKTADVLKFRVHKARTKYRMLRLNWLTSSRMTE